MSDEIPFAFWQPGIIEKSAAEQLRYAFARHRRERVDALGLGPDIQGDEPEAQRDTEWGRNELAPPIEPYRPLGCGKALAKTLCDRFVSLAQK
jgi:hypothetical protein